MIKRNNKSNLPIMELFGIIMSLLVLIGLFIIISDFFATSLKNIDIAKSNANAIKEFVDSNSNLNQYGSKCYNYLNLQNLEFVQNFEDNDFYIYIIREGGVYVYGNDVYKEFDKIFEKYNGNSGLLFGSSIPQNIYKNRVKKFNIFLNNKKPIYKASFNSNLNLFYEYYPNKWFDDILNWFNGLLNLVVGNTQSSSSYFSSQINFNDIFKKDEYFILIPNNREGTHWYNLQDIKKNKNKNSFIIISLKKLREDKDEYFDDFNYYYDISKLVISNKNELIGIFSYDSLNYINENLCFFKQVLNSNAKYQTIQSYKNSFKRDYLYIDIINNKIEEKYKLFIDDNNNLQCQVLESNLFSSNSNYNYFNVYFNQNENNIKNDYFKLTFDQNLNLINISETNGYRDADDSEVIKSGYVLKTKVDFINSLKDIKKFKYNPPKFDNFKDLVKIFVNLKDNDVRLKFGEDNNCKKFNILIENNLCKHHFSLNQKDLPRELYNLYQNIDEIYKEYNKCEVFKNNIKDIDISNINDNKINIILNNFLDSNKISEIRLDLKKEEKDIYDFKISFYQKSNLIDNKLNCGYYLLEEADSIIDQDYYSCTSGDKYYIIYSDDIKYSNYNSKSFDYFIYDNRIKKILFYDSDLNDFVYVDDSKILKVSNNKVLLNDKEYNINYKNLKLKQSFFNKDFPVYYFISKYDNKDFLVILTKDQFNKLAEVPNDYNKQD